MKRVRAILFDLDETLVDRKGAFRRWCEDVAVRYGEASGTDGEKLVERTIDYDGAGTRERSQFFEWLSDRCPQGRATPGELRDDYDRRFVAFLASDPRVLHLLIRLKEDFTLGLVTRGVEEFQMAKLKRTGLHEVFDTIVIADEENGGPNLKTSLEKAVDAVGEKHGDVLFVGDEAGVLQAREAGLQTCWLKHGRAENGASADESIESIHDLPRLLGIPVMA